VAGKCVISDRSAVLSHAGTEKYCSISVFFSEVTHINFDKAAWFFFDEGAWIPARQVCQAADRDNRPHTGHLGLHEACLSFFSRRHSE